MQGDAGCRANDVVKSGAEFGTKFRPNIAGEPLGPNWPKLNQTVLPQSPRQALRTLEVTTSALVPFCSSGRLGFSLVLLTALVDSRRREQPSKRVLSFEEESRIVLGKCCGR